MARAEAKFFFEGRERTLTEIIRDFIPGAARGTLQARLKASGAANKTELVAYLAKPPKRGPGALLRQAVSASAVEATERRFSREARAKVDSVTKTKGCNSCGMVKPIEKIKKYRRANGRTGHICDTCESKRTPANKGSKK